MMQSIETTGRTQEDAIAAALLQLGMERDDVSVEVVDRAKPGFLGFGGNPAKVRVSYDDGKPDVPEMAAKAGTEEAGEKKSGKSQAKPDSKSEAKLDSKAGAKTESKTDSKSGGKTQVKAEKASSAPEKTGGKGEQSPAVKEKSQETGGFSSKEGRSEEKPKGERRQREPLTQAEVEVATEEIRTFLEGLFTHLHLEASPEITQEEGDFQVKLTGENLGALIGRRGETLDAIQQLTGYVVNKNKSKRVRIFLDAENYRVKREDTLKKLAEKVAEEAVKHRRNVVLESMNAYERHIIHAALQDVPHISTYSTGSDPNRRTVVCYNPKK